MPAVTRQQRAEFFHKFEQEPKDSLTLLNQKNTGRCLKSSEPAPVAPKKTSREQYLRNPYGSKLTLTSFSKKGKQFRDHALDAVLANRERQKEMKQRRTNSKQRAWALRLLADISTSTGMEGDASNRRLKQRQPTSRLPVGYARPPERIEPKDPRLAAQVIEQSILSKYANPNSHTHYTYATLSVPEGADEYLKGRGGARSQKSELELRRIEAKARSRVLSDFLDRHKSVDREEAESKLNKQTYSSCPLKEIKPEQVKKAVIIQFKKPSIVTKEMLRVFFYSLNCVESVDKIWFTPSRTEVFVKFTFNLHIFNKEFRGVHMYVAMLQDLVHEMTSEDVTAFFNPDPQVSDAENQYALDIKTAIKEGFQNALVVPTSAQQMKAEMEKVRRRTAPGGRRGGEGTPRTRKAVLGSYQLNWPAPAMSVEEKKLRTRLVQEQLTGAKPGLGGHKDKSVFMTDLDLGALEGAGDDNMSGRAKAVAQHMTWNVTRNMEQLEQNPWSSR